MKFDKEEIFKILFQYSNRWSRFQQIKNFNGVLSLLSFCLHMLNNGMGIVRFIRISSYLKMLRKKKCKGFDSNLCNNTISQFSFGDLIYQLSTHLFEIIYKLRMGQLPHCCLAFETGALGRKKPENQSRDNKCVRIFHLFLMCFAGYTGKLNST